MILKEQNNVQIILIGDLKAIKLNRFFSHKYITEENP